MLQELTNLQSSQSPKPPGHTQVMPNEAAIRKLFTEGVSGWNSARSLAHDHSTTPGRLDPIVDLPDFSYTNFLWEFHKYSAPNKTWPISLSGIDLVEADLSHTMLRLVDLTKAVLVASFLNEANLNETKLVDADLTYADLTGASLNQADLTRANLEDAILTNARLDNAIVKDTNLTTTNLVGANLAGTRLWQAQIFPPDAPSPIQATDYHRVINSIDDLLLATRSLKDHHAGHIDHVELYFRGEPRLGWELRPSIMRDGYVASESKMLFDLMSSRPEDFSMTDSSLAQWVLAQHHGLRTRFLDITTNPMVALFHACEQSEQYDAHDGCLHIFAVPRSLIKSFNSDAASVVANFAKLSRFEQNLLLGRERVPKRQLYREPNRYREAMNRLYQLVQQEKQHFQDRIDVRDLFRVFVVEPQQISERLRVQSGAFLVSAFHERLERSEVERNVSGVPAYAHYVLPVPSGRKADIVEDLQLMNIKRETLYPGLDESAEAITYFYGQQQMDIGSNRDQREQDIEL